MEPWTPIEKDELEQIIREDLAACTPEQQAVFEQYRVPLRRAPIERYGKLEHVFIVAQRDDEVMYFEDIDEGFNFSPIDADGKILQHWCNQDELTYALWHWMGRPQEYRLGPAEPVPGNSDAVA
jgi:hypothetical protein